jgi:hypothetical protein
MPLVTAEQFVEKKIRQKYKVKSNDKPIWMYPVTMQDAIQWANEYHSFKLTENTEFYDVMTPEQLFMYYQEKLKVFVLINSKRYHIVAMRRVIINELIRFYKFYYIESDMKEKYNNMGFDHASLLYTSRKVKIALENNYPLYKQYYEKVTKITAELMATNKGNVQQ